MRIKIGIALIAVLFVLIVVVLAVRNTRQSNFADWDPKWQVKGTPDWIQIDVTCPPASPPVQDLNRISAGRILGAPEAEKVYVRDVQACAARCYNQNGYNRGVDSGRNHQCSGWAFTKSRPNIAADDTYTCLNFTADDKDIIVYPPATSGDYFSYSLNCAPRSGPTVVGSAETAITTIVNEAAVVGKPPTRHITSAAAADCLSACKDDSKCIGATFHGHSQQCALYDSPEGLVLMTMPGGHHVTSASFFAGDYAIPIYPAPLEAVSYN